MSVLQQTDASNHHFSSVQTAKEYFITVGSKQHFHIGSLCTISHSTEQFKDIEPFCVNIKIESLLHFSSEELHMLNHAIIGYTAAGRTKTRIPIINLYYPENTKKKYALTVRSFVAVAKGAAIYSKHSSTMHTMIAQFPAGTPKSFVNTFLTAVRSFKIITFDVFSTAGEAETSKKLREIESEIVKA